MNIKRILSVLVIASLIIGLGLVFSPKITSANGVVPNEVWVDDDFDASTPGWGYDHFATIQDGVDAVADGGVVHVASGTYEESVTINKDLSLIGSGNPVIKCPATPEDVYVEESGHQYQYVMGIFGGTYDPGDDEYSGSGTVDVIVSGFEIDSDNFVPTDRYVAIFFRNLTGTISNCTIVNTDVNGHETFGILGYGDEIDVIIENNTVDQFARGGIGVNGGSFLIQSNTVIGPGLGVPVTWAPNGIQVGYGASGVVKNNEVSGCGWPGTDWAGTGILVVDTHGVTVDNNYVHDCEQAIGAVDFPAIYGDPWLDYLSDVTISNNRVIGNEWGITINNDARNITVIGNTITDNLYDAIDVWNYGYGDPSPTNVEIHYNDIYGNGWGLWTDDLQTDTVDATNNWWGSNDGPSGAGPGSGDGVEGNVDYDPWLREVEATTTAYGDVSFYFTPGASPAMWRIVIPSKGYDTGWMPFDRFTSSRNYMSGWYTDKIYKFVLNYYSSGRYRIIFYDRREGISLKIAGRG